MQILVIRLLTSLNRRITNYLDCAGIPGDEQAGFRSGFSTTDRAFTLNCIIYMYLQREKKSVLFIHRLQKSL